MKPDTEILLLREEEVVPTDSVLEDAMGKTLYLFYTQLIATATREHGIEIQWRYYKDGKAWLCKAVYKRKTVFWLSIWEGFVQTSFFFTDKTKQGILDLNVDDEIKKNLESAKAIGKLYPLIMAMISIEQLGDFFEIVGYKKGLK